MGQCHLCHWSGGLHDKACPEVAGAPALALADYRQGWGDGRSGRREPESARATYKLGWIRGTVALEAAENGHDPRFDA